MLEGPVHEGGSQNADRRQEVKWEMFIDNIFKDDSGKSHSEVRHPGCADVQPLIAPQGRTPPSPPIT